MGIKTLLISTLPLQEQKEKSIIMGNPAVKYGVYYGAVLILLSIISWQLIPSIHYPTTMKQAGVGSLLSLIVVIGFLYLSLKETRYLQEGFLSFGEGLKSSFLTYMIGTLMGTIFCFLLLNYIAPDLLTLQKESGIAMASDMANWMGELAGMPEEELESLNEDMEAEIELQNLGSFSVGAAILAWLGSLIGGLLLSLIMSAIMKKND